MTAPVIHEPPAAEWDFRLGPTLTATNAAEFELENAGPSAPIWAPDDCVGGGIVFSGDGGHLRVPSDQAGLLDMSEAGEVTVMALVRRDGLGRGFIAGLWQEHDDDPRRQYGLFIDLPAYGGADQVIGHISHDGRPSPGLPYSRDYAASARMLRPGPWRVVGFRYDGRDATAFLDGIADPRPSFTEVGPPLGRSLTYSKNPYHYAHGLNPGIRSDFTVGAVMLTTGIGNAFVGSIARLAIWSRALDDGAIASQALAWTPRSAPVVRFDWWRADPSPAAWRGGWHGALWPVATTGCSQISGMEVPVLVARDRLVREAAPVGAVVHLPMHGYDSAHVDRIDITGVTDRARVQATIIALADGGSDVHARRIHATSTRRSRDSVSLSFIGAPPAHLDAIELQLAAGARLELGEITVWTPER